MTPRAEYLYKRFIERLEVEATTCQDALLAKTSSFLTEDDADILVVNGYAGTGKTTAVSAVIGVLEELKLHCVLLAPTGRAAKVLSSFAGRPAYTVHKHIYRQKGVGEDGFGKFSLSPNKAKNTLFVVDEVSLIGIEEQEKQGGTAFGSGNLLADLVSFVRSGVDCRLMLLGDAAQLPPVGLEASPALCPEFMDGFGGVTYAELSSVVRQAADSGILRNATAIRKMISGADVSDTFDEVKLDVRKCPDVERIGGGELIETLTDAYSKYGEDGTIILCRSNTRRTGWCVATS